MANLSTNQIALIGYMTRDDRLTARGFDLILRQAHPEAFLPELRKAGLFNPHLNPKPQPVKGNEGYYRVPSWPALNYLVKVARISGERDDKDLANELLEIVREIALYEDGGDSVDNYHTHSGIAEVMSCVPSACVKMEDIDLTSKLLSTRWGNSIIMTELDRLMARLLSSESSDDHAKAVLLLKHCTEFKLEAGDGSKPSRTAVADEYWLEELLKHNAKGLGEKACPDAWEVFRVRLNEVLGDDYAKDHSWIHRPAIEEHEQNEDWDNGPGALIDAARDSLNSWLESSPEAATAYVAELLADPSQIVRRIALNSARAHWDKLKDVFERAITPELFDIGHIHELYMLLNERFVDFSTAAQGRFLAIMAGLGGGKAEGSEELERALYQKRTWLDAVKQKGRQEIDDEYNNLVTKLGPVGSHPSFLSYHSSWWGSGPSPYSQDELTAFAADGSLVDRIDSYSPPKGEMGSSRKALVDELIGAVELKPTEFFGMLKSEKKANRPTQYGLIEGFSKAIDKRKGDDSLGEVIKILDLLLPYASRIVSPPDFWSERVEDVEGFEPNKNWIPPSVVDLARNVLRNDEIPLKEEHYNDILSSILAVKDESQGVDSAKDPMTAAINNSRGKAVDALLHFVLRRCRDADKFQGGHEAAWMELRGVLDTEISGCVDGARLETSTLFASFLAQLIYIDASWVGENIEKLFPKAHSENFLCAISGLSFANSSKRVYEALMKADIPRYALQQKGVSSGARERLLERIALAYMWGQEDLNSPVIQEMFADEFIDDLVEIATTVARWHSAKLKPEQVGLAKRLASAVVDFGLEAPERRKGLLATGANFIFYIAAPSEDEMRWLLSSAPYANKSFGRSQYLEALEKIAENDPPNALKLLQAFLGEGAPSYNHEGRLQSILRKLNEGELHLEVLKVVDNLVKETGDMSLTELFKELRGRAQSA